MKNSDLRWPASIVSKVLDLVEEGVSLQGLRKASELFEAEPGLTTSSVVSIAEEMLSIGTIGILEGKLFLIDSSGINHDESQLLQGRIEAWELLDRVNPELGRKFDEATAKELGDAGEKFVLSELRRLLPVEMHERIRHVAEYDDTAGFDIVAPSISVLDIEALLEVKTSVRPPRSFGFYISRNEFRVGERRGDWRLVCVRRQGEAFNVVGHLTIEQLKSHIPTDQGSGLWESCHILIDEAEILPGLP